MEFVLPCDRHIIFTLFSCVRREFMYMHSLLAACRLLNHGAVLLNSPMHLSHAICIHFWLATDALLISNFQRKRCTRIRLIWIQGDRFTFSSTIEIHCHLPGRVILFSNFTRAVWSLGWPCHLLLLLLFFRFARSLFDKNVFTSKHLSQLSVRGLLQFWSLFAVDSFCAHIQYTPTV